MLCMIKKNPYKSRDPLTSFTLPHFHACPKPGRGFPTPWSFLCSVI